MDSKEVSWKNSGTSSGAEPLKDGEGITQVIKDLNIPLSLICNLQGSVGLWSVDSFMTMHP